MGGAKGWMHHVFSKITQPWLVSWKAWWGSELSSGTFCRQPPGRGLPWAQAAGEHPVLGCSRHAHFCPHRPGPTSEPKAQD